MAQQLIVLMPINPSPRKRKPMTYTYSHMDGRVPRIFRQGEDSEACQPCACGMSRQPRLVTDMMILIRNKVQHVSRSGLPTHNQAKKKPTTTQLDNNTT